MDSVTSYIFQSDMPFQWQAGQFLHYKLLHVNEDDRKDERYFTIATAPHEANIMVTTRLAEKSSSFKKALGVLAAKYPTLKMQYIAASDIIDEAKIKEVAPDFAHTKFYVSGPEPMVEAFEKWMPAMGIPEDNIRRDYFPGYDWP